MMSHCTTVLLPSGPVQSNVVCFGPGVWYSVLWCCAAQHGVVCRCVVDCSAVQRGVASDLLY